MHIAHAGQADGVRLVGRSRSHAGLDLGNAAVFKVQPDALRPTVFQQGLRKPQDGPVRCVRGEKSLGHGKSPLAKI